MEISSKFIGGAEVISYFGNLDSPDSYKFLRYLKDNINKGTNKIVIDFSSIRFVSSSGFAAILSSLKLARDTGGDIKIANVPDNIKAHFITLGLESRFPFYDSVESAVVSFPDPSL